MSPSRQRSAVRRPAGDVTGFPRKRLASDRPIYRAHAVGNGPWWFSSDLSGRFDLPVPQGTCYLAVDAVTALRERFGHALVKLGIVTYEAATETLVSELQVPVDRWLANTCSPDAADFSMTREIATCASYKIPQSWAEAFLKTGRHTGIHYLARFSTGSKSFAIALFAGAGEQGWDIDDNPTPGIQACAEAGINVEHPPTARQVRVVQPPRK